MVLTMAKTVNCAFCGKEMKAGFLGIFGSECEHLHLGDMSLICCDACYAKYRAFAEREGKRIGAKLENMCYNSDELFRKTSMSQKKMAELFLDYMELSCAYTTDETYCGFFIVAEPTKNSPVNTFLAEEAQIESYESEETFLNKCKDVIAEEAQRGLDAEFFGNIYQKKKPWVFTAHDISCFEYSCGSEKVMGDCIGLPVKVKLNDFRQMTYKPCMISGMITYKSVIFNQKKYRDEKLREAMTALRATLGVEHLPMTEVSEFR